MKTSAKYDVRAEGSAPLDGSINACGLAKQQATSITTGTVDLQCKTACNV
jgi:hypothetical protein